MNRFYRGGKRWSGRLFLEYLVAVMRSVIVEMMYECSCTAIPVVYLDAAIAAATAAVIQRVSSLLTHQRKM